jgi:hypothetical protein
MPYSCLATPHLWLSYMPHSWLSYMPHPWLSCMPHPWLNHMPHPWLSYMPHPWLSYMPHPWLSYMPHPWLSYMPHPWLSYMPHPRLRYMPLPRLSFMSHPWLRYATPMAYLHHTHDLTSSHPTHHVPKNACRIRHRKSSTFKKNILKSFGNWLMLVRFINSVDMRKRNTRKGCRDLYGAQYLVLQGHTSKRYQFFPMGLH